MQTIGQVINSRHVEVNPKGLKHEWQAFAYKIWVEYDGNPKTLSNVMRFVRTHNDKSRALLDTAYSFCIDYQGHIPKINLFYWKFWQMKKAKT